MKPLPKSKAIKQTGDPAISSTLRKEILERDNYRCIFDGRDGSVMEIQVGHIIPRSLIKKLHLDSALQTARENLCALCKECNVTKKDYLKKGAIAYYIQAFADPSHPNHGLVPHLAKIAQLQKQRLK